jgi:hypothetical protein
MKREFYALVILILICPLFSENTSPSGCGDPQGKPIVLYDFYHTSYRDTYSRFNSILSNQFDLKYTREPLTCVRRSNCDILVISTPLRYFSGEEFYTIRRFVIEGGGLLLMGNGWYWVDTYERPIEDFPLNQIGREFNVTVNDDGILDPTNEERYTIFSNFTPHPVTEGLTKIQSGIPSSLSITRNAIPIVRGDEDSYSGYHQPIYKAGDFPPIAAALEYGRGRILFLGQDGFFSNSDIHNYDNLRFGLNIFDWLTPSSSDNDEDGYSPPSDCNDNDSDVNPGAPEICDDAKDNDCDGYTDCSDSDCTASSNCDHDRDDDGYDSTAYGGDDCNDNDSDVNPGAPEDCDDAKDNDCDGYTDCSDPDCTASSNCDYDKDDDGYDSTAYGGDDCNDNDSEVNPGAPEKCDDAKDNDCDGYTDCSDPDCEANSRCIDKGHLLVSVVNLEGQGLKAAVSINGYKGETDSAGMFTMFDLEANKEYTIRVGVPGYNPEETTVIVEKNTTTQVMIQMEKGNFNWVPIFLLLFSSIGLILLVLKFRSKLGKETVPETRPTQMYCPHCGNKVKRTWDSCTYCGCDLREYTHIFDDGTRPY